MRGLTIAGAAGLIGLIAPLALAAGTADGLRLQIASNCQASPPQDLSGPENSAELQAYCECYAGELAKASAANELEQIVAGNVSGATSDKMALATITCSMQH